MTTQREQLSREEIAKREIGVTAISRRAAFALTALFLTTVLAVPVAQHLRELRRGNTPQCYDIAAGLPRAVRAFVRSDRGIFGRVFEANGVLLRDINHYEDTLADESWLKEWLVPPTQVAMTRFGGVGNEKVHVGRDGWLFYRPGIEYVAGRGFLDPHQLAKRAAGGNEWQAAPQPDPAKAILHFRDQLRQRGIRLIVLPIPVKPVVHPDRYTGVVATGREDNASYQDLTGRLCSEGVRVFHEAKLGLMLSRSDGRPQFLKTDTHWTPEAMDRCAEWLARTLVKEESVARGRTRYKRIATAITNTGDLTRMLNLPESCTLFPPETVTIQQVFDREDNTWRADKASDVLLLGDSFCNIYSYDAMGWGFSAGLAEQLSVHLRKPVDRIVRNDSGAFATRQMLANELAKGRDRLAGKKVVIWQFAVRELTEGDWRLIDLKLGTPGASEFLGIGETQTLTVTGTIAQVTPCPRPFSKPYRDYIVAIHLVDLDSHGPETIGRDALVYAWGMKDNRWKDAARFRVDQRVTLRLSYWDEDAKRADLNRGDPGPGFEMAFPCWGEVVKE